MHTSTRINDDTDFKKFRNVGQEHCIEEESNGQLATFFDWLTKSTYEGKKKYREIDYDLYGYTVSECLVCWFTS